MKMNKQLAKETRDRVLLNNNGLCKKCGKTENVLARPIYLSSFNLYNDSNYVCLCSKCLKKIRKSELGYIIECLRLMQKNT